VAACSDSFRRLASDAAYSISPSRCNRSLNAAAAAHDMSVARPSSKVKRFALYQVAFVLVALFIAYGGATVVSHIMLSPQNAGTNRRVHSTTGVDSEQLR
jgi:hypothetical protein